MIRKHPHRHLRLNVEPTCPLEYGVIPLAERVRRFYQTVDASCLWGAGAWTPSAALRAELDAADLQRVGWMTGVYNRPTDSWAEFYRRRRRAADHLRAADGPPWTLFHRACHAPHAWLGHVSRHADSPPGAALAWRDVGWWTAMQCLGSQPEQQPAGWRYPRTNWQRHAEAVISSFAGATWKAAAADRAGWNASRTHFVSWCVANFGGAAPPEQDAGRVARRRAA